MTTLVFSEISKKQSEQVAIEERQTGRRLRVTTEVHGSALVGNADLAKDGPRTQEEKGYPVTTLLNEELRLGIFK